jgi:hypothetical protein
MPQSHDEFPSHDLLLGARALTAYINRMLDADSQIIEKNVYDWVAREHIPVRRIGSRIVASKTAVRARLFPR